MTDSEYIKELEARCEKFVSEVARLRNDYAWARNCLSEIRNHKDDTGANFEVWARQFAAGCLETRCAGSSNG